MTDFASPGFNVPSINAPIVGIDIFATQKRYHAALMEIRTIGKRAHQGTARRDQRLAEIRAVVNRVLGEPKEMDPFEAAGRAAAGFGMYGWWRCSVCGGFAGYESSPAASSVTPFCRTGDHGFVKGMSYELTHDPEPEDRG